MLAPEPRELLFRHAVDEPFAEEHRDEVCGDADSPCGHGNTNHGNEFQPVVKNLIPAKNRFMTS